MKINDVYREICDNPHDDAPRLLFADLVEPSEPTWAAYIRRAIDDVNGSRRGRIADTDYLRKGAERWAASLLPLAAHGRVESLEFHRGFPSRIRIHPHVFAEYGEQLFRLAPIRHVDFVHPYGEDGKPILDEKGEKAWFPIADVLSCPALDKLESIGFPFLRLPRDWAAQLVACPYLTSCLLLWLHEAFHFEEDILAIMESPAVRKMIHIQSDHVGRGQLGLSSQRSHGQGGPETTTYFYPPLTKEVEAKYGYIPWLHHGYPSRLDIHYYVASGKYPKFPVGSLPPRDEWYELPDPIHHRATW